MKSRKQGLSPIPSPADAPLKADLLAHEGKMRWFVFLGQFDDERVTEVGRYLDAALESVLRNAAE